MGLRCLLGHEYANREVEREREERGNEVVVTYRTVETCDRCGERRIVSENKEVRPVRDPESETVSTGLGGGVTPDLGDEDDDTADDGIGVTGETPAQSDAETPPTSAPAPQEGVTADDGATPDDGGVTVDEGLESGSEDATADDDPTPDDGGETADDVDDAIILDDGPGADRDHGEWPDADPAEDAATAATPDPDAADDGATVVSDGDEWPDTAGEDEGYAAEPDDGDPADVTFGGELTPTEAGDGSAAANGTASATGKQFVAAETVDPVRQDEAHEETEFYCPNCGFARIAGGSSMRAGDICPDCHQGYIAERRA
jgi:predicted RNA-binding Zn-ribbon protein involved in translation (DUF1610 family)